MCVELKMSCVLLGLKLGLVPGSIHLFDIPNSLWIFCLCVICYHTRKHSRMQRVREAKLRYNSGEMLLYNHKVQNQNQKTLDSISSIIIHCMLCCPGVLGSCVLLYRCQMCLWSPAALICRGKHVYHESGIPYC